jgi:hypothetical protein
MALLFLINYGKLQILYQINFQLAFCFVGIIILCFFMQGFSELHLLVENALNWLLLLLFCDFRILILFFFNEYAFLHN